MMVMIMVVISMKCQREIAISNDQWIGLLGKILTGNHGEFTIKLIGLSG